MCNMFNIYVPHINVLNRGTVLHSLIAYKRNLFDTNYNHCASFESHKLCFWLGNVNLLISIIFYRLR